jgi:hypothetical protein
MVSREAGVGNIHIPLHLRPEKHVSGPDMISDQSKLEARERESCVASQHARSHRPLHDMMCLQRMASCSPAMFLCSIARRAT